MIDDKDTDKDTEEYHLGDADLLGMDSKDSSTVDKNAEKSKSEPLKIKPQESEEKEEPSQLASSKSADHVEKFFEDMRSKNKYFIIGGLVGIFILYYFISLMFEKSPTKPVMQNPAPQKIISSPAPLPDIIPKEPQPQIPLGFVNEVKAKISQVINDEQKTQADLQTVTSTLTSIQTSVNEMKQKMADLDKAMAGMTQQVEAKIDQLKMLDISKQKPKPKKIHHHRRARGSNSSIYLQAIIPGRAWLINKDGTNTFTVREGTKIPGIGVVQVIDPEQSRVVLTSGQIITFGQWDS